MTLLQVTAVDKDLGSNSDIEYSIYDGQSAHVNDWFTIDTSSGVISLKQALTGKGMCPYRMTCHYNVSL